MAEWDPNKIWTLTGYIPFPQSYPLVEHNAVHHEAWVLGIELDPSEGQEGLRERVEAVKAGDTRAHSVASWAPVRAQKEQQREAAQRLAIVNVEPFRSVREVIQQASRECEEEIRRRQPLGVALNAAPKDGLVEVAVFTGSMPTRGPILEGTPIPSTAAPTYPVRSADAIRAENCRIGEEIAKASPAWAYPLAWRLAVMAVVEAHNNTKTIVPFDTRYWEQQVTPSLRAYHQARLDGFLPEPAMMKAVQEGVDVPLDKSFVEKFYDGIACRAYERGRPGPGGVR